MWNITSVRTTFLLSKYTIWTKTNTLPATGLQKKISVRQATVRELLSICTSDSIEKLFNKSKSKYRVVFSKGYKVQHFDVPCSWSMWKPAAANDDQYSYNWPYPYIAKQVHHLLAFNQTWLRETHRSDRKTWYRLLLRLR